MQVFISHASPDRVLADRLSNKLRESGIDVWNPASIFPGDNWALETGKALEQSEVMVVLYTQRARRILSLRQDIQYALTQGNYRGRVVPVFVGLSNEEAREDVPWILFHLHPLWLDGASPELDRVVVRVQSEIESGCNASA